MKRMVLSVISAAALALSPVGAPPAQAIEGEQLLGILLGIGTIYVIGKAIDDSRTTSTPRSRSSATGKPPQMAPEPRRNDHHRTLPGRCLNTFDTWHGRIRGFGEECLERTMARASRLPDNCAIRTRVGTRDRTIYSARCLQLEGWQVARADSPPRPTGPNWRGGTRLGN
jgi:hypothetical protein